MFIPLTDIVVKERIREEIGEDEIKELKSSLLAFGQLQPIVVVSAGDKWELLAGERRLVAVRQLEKEGRFPSHNGQLGHIWADTRDSPSPHIKLQIEFDENMKRKDFTFVEKAKFIRRFHETMIDTAKDAGGSWTAELTAVAIRMSPASISHYLRIEEAIKTDAAVAGATTMSAAVKRMKVREKLEARKLLVEKEAPDTLSDAKKVILLGDAKVLIKNVPDGSISLVNFDPPWGDDVGYKSNNAAWGENFSDDTETSDDIINTLLPELFRVLKQDSFLIFWYRAWAYTDMCARLEQAGFNLKFTRTPCIWNKPDKVSDQQRVPEKALINAYETFLIARKGDPVFAVQGIQNVFNFPRVPIIQLIHPTEKPIELCEVLVNLCTVPGETVLDPTAGSGSILRAALKNGRKAIGFELSNDNHTRATTKLAETLKPALTVANPFKGIKK